MLVHYNHHLEIKAVGPIPADTDAQAIAEVIGGEIALMTKLIARKEGIINDWVRTLSVAHSFTYTPTGRFLILTACLVTLRETEDA